MEIKANIYWIHGMSHTGLSAIYASLDLILQLHAQALL